MSTKCTIFLTDDDEHCYYETIEEDDGKSRVYLEIDRKNIFSLDSGYKDGVMLIGLRGNSDIASKIARRNYDNN